MTSLIALLPYIQIALSVLLVVAILLQKSEAGVGGAFGGNDNFNAGFHTRRGFEQNYFISPSRWPSFLLFPLSWL